MSIVGDPPLRVDEPVPARRRTWLVAVVVAASVMAVAVVAFAALAAGARRPEPHVPPVRPQAGIDLYVGMIANHFDAYTYRVTGGELTVSLRNRDHVMHTFTIPELGIDEIVGPRATRTVTMTVPAGTYTVYCRPHADMHQPDPVLAGMAATLVAASAGPAASTLGGT